MEGILETQRRAHEEIDRLEQAAVDILLNVDNTQKGRLIQELNCSAILDQISQTASQLLNNYKQEESRSLRSKEIESITITGGSEFGNFYTRLKELKDEHRRFAADHPIDNSDFEALLNSLEKSPEEFDNLFSGEEVNGKYLDLLLPYQRYINLKDVRKLDYLQYLQEFDNFGAIPRSTKLSHPYSKYLEELESYFCRFFKLSKPLFDIETVKRDTQTRFEEDWKSSKVLGWEDLSRKELEDSNSFETIFCGPCNKTFTNQSVYKAHLAGKKHIKASETYKGDENDPKVKVETENHKNDSNYKKLALNEALITKYSEILGEIREGTRINVERKQSRTLEEREEDFLVEESEPLINEINNEEEDGDKEGQIYNPLNLPLDWDGKPIPYWLWKLHGLGVRFPCEICGNHVYMGRKAFDQHFFEWRHSNGMKALGIPNTKHFFQITRMDEAQALWDRLRQTSRLENFRPEAMEEFEDHAGNVYNRKTYEDLRRQGLI